MNSTQSLTAFVYSADSQLKMAGNFISAHGIRGEMVLFDDFLAAVRSGKNDCSRIISFVSGRDFLVLWLYLHAFYDDAERPLLVTCPVGITLPAVATGMYQFRECADVVVCPNRFELVRAESIYSKISPNPPELIELKLPIFGDAEQSAGEDGENIHFDLTGRDTFIYFGQPSLPNQLESFLLMKRICEIAIANPKKTFLIKPRFEKGTPFFAHKPSYYLEDVLQSAQECFTTVPGNVRITHESVSSLLSDSVIALGISTTALLEALHHGIPAISLCDYGVRENLGNDYFLDSGILMNLDEALARRELSVNRRWLESTTSSNMSFSLADVRKRRFGDSFWGVNGSLPLVELSNHLKTLTEYDLAPFSRLFGKNEEALEHMLGEISRNKVRRRMPKRKIEFRKQVARLKWRVYRWSVSLIKSGDRP
jgi:hypothetical protein